jgi:hypothetical protein
MACGNNKVSRAYLSSPPTSVGQRLGATAVGGQLGSTPGLASVLGQQATKRVQIVEAAERVAGRKDTYVGERGPDRDRHVHVVHGHREHRGSEPDSRVVLVQVTDRTQSKSLGTGGHHEFVLFLQNPDARRVESAISDMLRAMKSRPRGRARGT